MNDLVELEFRDGKRWVPAYLADMMAGIETYRYPYEEARKLANGEATRRYVSGQFDKVIESHFKKMR